MYLFRNLSILDILSCSSELRGKKKIQTILISNILVKVNKRKKTIKTNVSVFPFTVMQLTTPVFIAHFSLPIETIENKRTMTWQQPRSIYHTTLLSKRCVTSQSNCERETGEMVERLVYLTVCLSSSEDLICAFNMSLWISISWRRCFMAFKMQKDKC